MIVMPANTLYRDQKRETADDLNPRIRFWYGLQSAKVFIELIMSEEIFFVLVASKLGVHRRQRLADYCIFGGVIGSARNAVAGAGERARVQLHEFCPRRKASHE